MLGCVGFGLNGKRTKPELQSDFNHDGTTGYQRRCYITRATRASADWTSGYVMTVRPYAEQMHSDFARLLQHRKDRAEETVSIGTSR